MNCMGGNITTFMITEITSTFHIMTSMLEESLKRSLIAAYPFVSYLFFTTHLSTKHFLFNFLWVVLLSLIQITILEVLWFQVFEDMHARLRNQKLDLKFMPIFPTEAFSVGRIGCGAVAIIRQECCLP